MTRLYSFVRLDFITVKPYLTIKNLLIYIGIALFMLIPTDSTAGTCGILMALGAQYASYPFAIGEKNNMDVLYATLSISRDTVVLGRYLFALTLDILMASFAFGISLIVLTVMQRGFNVPEFSLTILLLFMVFSLTQAIQLPIYFKLGYTKAKFLAYLPFIVFPLVIVMLPQFFRAFVDVFSLERIRALAEWLIKNRLSAALAGGAIWLVIMLVSYKVSVSRYRQRDF